MNTSPLVSIVMAAYNAEMYIGDAIRSVLCQTYREFELIVVDDGSSDSTAKRVGAFNDSRVLLLSQENKGQDAALNAGYRVAKGEWVKFMDSDDLINPDMLRLQVERLEANPGHVAYSEWDRFYDDRPDLARFQPLDYWKDMAPLDFLTARPEGVMLQCGSILVPRTIIEKAGLWDERLILYNDTEFFTRVILASSGVLFTPGARLYYRSGLEKSLSAQRARKFFESTYLATCMIGERMLAAENSERVRQLIANMFFDRYTNMYPQFRALGKKHAQKIAEYGEPTITMGGGASMKIASKLLGWKGAKMAQWLINKLRFL